MKGGFRSSTKVLEKSAAARDVADEEDGGSDVGAVGAVDEAVAGAAATTTVVLVAGAAALVVAAAGAADVLGACGARDVLGALLVFGAGGADMEIK